MKSKRKSLRILNKEIKLSKKRGNVVELKNLIKIKEILSEPHKREIKEIQKNINVLFKIINSKINFFSGSAFSGSVQKNTYVHNLSDIDILIFLDKRFLVTTNPRTIQNKILKELKTQLPNQTIKKNKEAIDFFIKSSKVQMVPVILEGQYLFFPGSRGKTWKKINSDLFRILLEREDKRFLGKITLSIKINKIILSRYSKYKIKGHHLEILTYLSCRKIKNKRIPLLELVSKILYDSSRNILHPIKDSSGQFTFIDEYLGEEKSLKRKLICKELNKILEKLNKELVL